MQKSKPDNQSSKAYARYSSLVIQMAVIIGVSVFLGIKIDDWTGNENVWAIIISLLGVILAIYWTIKQIINISKEDE